MCAGTLLLHCYMCYMRLERICALVHTEQCRAVWCNAQHSATTSRSSSSSVEHRRLLLVYIWYSRASPITARTLVLYISFSPSFLLFLSYTTFTCDRMMCMYVHCVCMCCCVCACAASLFIDISLARAPFHTPNVHTHSICI